MNQDTAGLCGPVAFLYGLASNSPATYARYAVDLYEKGNAKIGDILAPSTGCRTSSPPCSMSPADWLAAASLRNSDNWWFDVDVVNVESPPVHHRRHREMVCAGQVIPTSSPRAIW